MKPLPRKAREGRANPKGIPYLYLATDQNTCLAELRPQKGDQLSCAQFRVLKDLRVVDCYSVPKHIGMVTCIFRPPESAEDIESAIWTMINDSYSRPTRPDDEHSLYIPTQVLAEFFKSQGFDGVCYKSGLGDGYNMVLFRS